MLKVTIAYYTSAKFFSLEFICTSYTTYSPYLFLGAWLSQQAMLEDPLVLLGCQVWELPDHRACLCSQPRSRTRRPFPTLCSETAPTTKHVYVSNHARILVDHFLCYAQGLPRPLNMFTFPTALGDSSTTPYAMLRYSFGHSPTTTWGLLFSVTYKLDTYTTERCFLFLDLATRFILHLPASLGTTSV